MTEPKRRSGGRQDYGTPPELLKAMGRDFDLDLAASPANAKAPRFYTEAEDSLVQPWDGKCMWLNPPFGNTSQWVRKSTHWYTENDDDKAELWLLVAAAPGSNWYRDYVWPHARTIFLNGRLTFEGMTQPFDRDCMLLQYGMWEGEGVYVWDWRREVFPC